MTLKSAKELQKWMPYKKIYLDLIYKCHRLINPNELYEYKDEEGKSHKRHNVITLKEFEVVGG